MDSKSKKVKFCVTFKGKPGKKVFLCGDFNEWKVDALEMKNVGGGKFEAEVELEQGEYEYKFFVDGVWFNDPAAPQEPNIWGSENSIIKVK
jgi:1,4-alpha-glucan branching enzyme